MSQEESDAAHRIDPSIFSFNSTRSPRWCHVHHPPSFLRQFWGKLGNPSSTCFQVKQATRTRRVSCANLLLPVLWGNWQTVACLVLRPKPRNRRGDFKAQITKLELPILRPKPENSTTLVLRSNQETRTPHLLVHGADHTRRHPASRSFGHRVPDLCLTIPGPLHQVSYSCHNPCHCPSCRTSHLHTMRQANVIIYMNKDKSKTT
jgi:hypothetical protein